MARKPTGKPTGRPPRDFDKKIFEGLCHVQCTVNEIEAILHADQRTIDSWCNREYGEDFNTVYKRFAEGGKASVRRNQINLSKTNSSMAIWLGKILLGQRDPQEEDNSRAMGRVLGLLDRAKAIEVASAPQENVTNSHNTDEKNVRKSHIVEKTNTKS